MRQKQRLNRRLLYLVVISTATLFLFLTYKMNWRGAKTPQDLVDTYVRALENKDQSLMLWLVPESYYSEQEVQDKVMKLGGHDIQEIQVSYKKIKPHIAIATIEGWYVDSKGKPVNFKDIINLRYESGSFLVSYKGRWYLNLGRSKNPVNLGPASTPF